MKPQMLFGAVMAIINAFNTGWIGVALSDPIRLRVIQDS